MITPKHLAALLGFAFAAAWIGFNFGYAVLCLVAAAVFYFATSLVEGGVDLGELQARFGRGESRGQQPWRPPTGRRVR